MPIILLSAAPASTAGRRTILLVDDEDDIRESLKMLFELSLDGVEVVTASGGREGLDALARDKVDVIVTDYKMPEMNGAEFLSQASKRAPGIPRILISAFPGVIQQDGALGRVQVDAFFPKPLDTDKLLGTLERLLASPNP